MSAIVATLRAGRLVRDGSLMKPDSRKGEITLTVDDQSLLHFQWRERTDTGAEPELDSIIFPGEASFEKVRQLWW